MPIVKDKENKIDENVKKENQNKKIEFQPMEPLYCFDEIILNKNEEEKVLDVLCYNEYHELVFLNWGLKNTHKMSKKIGINLFGAPGTGKTMIAHAIADKFKRKIIQIDYSEIESKYVGETSKNLVKAFNTAKETNSILLFDEADALLSRRVSSMSNSTDVSVNQTRSVLLTLLNDHNDLVVFTTNFIENFDTAFMRRIHSHIEIAMPKEETRVRLWKKYIPENLPTDCDIDILAKKYENVSGSDISNAVLLSAFKGARKKEKIVRHEYFEEAITSIIDSKKKNEIKTVTQSISEEEANKILKLK